MSAEKNWKLNSIPLFSVLINFYGLFNNHNIAVFFSAYISAH